MRMQAIDTSNQSVLCFIYAVTFVYLIKISNQMAQMNETLVLKNVQRNVHKTVFKSKSTFEKFS